MKASELTKERLLQAIADNGGLKRGIIATIAKQTIRDNGKPVSRQYIHQLFTTWGIREVQA
jgi:hypothetical protein